MMPSVMDWDKAFLDFRDKWLKDNNKWISEESVLDLVGDALEDAWYAALSVKED